MRFSESVMMVLSAKFGEHFLKVTNVEVGLRMKGVRDADVGLVKCFGDETLC